MHALDYFVSWILETGHVILSPHILHASIPSYLPVAMFTYPSTTICILITCFPGYWRQDIHHPVSSYPPCIHSKLHSCSYVHVSIHNHLHPYYLFPGYWRQDIHHPVTSYPPCIHSKLHSCSYVHVSIHHLSNSTILLSINSLVSTPPLVRIRI